MAWIWYLVNLYLTYTAIDALLTHSSAPEIVTAMMGIKNAVSLQVEGFLHTALGVMIERGGFSPAGAVFLETFVNLTISELKCNLTVTEASLQASLSSELSNLSGIALFNSRNSFYVSLTCPLYVMSRTYKAFDDNSDHAAAYYVRGEEARCAALAGKNAYRPVTWIGPIAAYDSEHQHSGWRRWFGVRCIDLTFICSCITHFAPITAAFWFVWIVSVVAMFIFCIMRSLVLCFASVLSCGCVKVNFSFNLLIGDQRINGGQVHILERARGLCNMHVFRVGPCHKMLFGLLVTIFTLGISNMLLSFTLLGFFGPLAGDPLVLSWARVVLDSVGRQLITYLVICGASVDVSKRIVF